MLKNHKLAKSISEVLQHEFRVLLEYKVKLYGQEIIMEPSNYAISQICRECGY